MPGPCFCPEAQAAEKAEGKTSAKAQKAKIAGAKVLAFGVFSSVVVRREKVLTVADGIKDKAKDFKLLRRGAKAEAALGEGVGLRYVIEGAPKGAAVLIDVVVRHPQLVNPDTQQPMTHSTAQFERRIGAVEHSVWSFDTQADLVPGEYVVELLHTGPQPGPAGVPGGHQALGRAP